MKEISSNSLPALLEKSGNTPPTLWFITGDEPLLALEAEDQIRAVARKAGYSDRRTFAFDGNSDYTPLIDALADMSLFGEKQLIEVRLLKGNPGTRTGPKAIDFAIQNAGPNNLIIFSSPPLEDKQKKSDWYKKIASKAVVVTANVVPRSQLPAWIQNRMKNQGQFPDEEAVNFIANRTEGNLFACEQEIRKLALLAPQGPLKLEQVKDAVSDVSRFDPDDLSIAILEGDPSRVAKIIDGLQSESVAIPSFLWILIEDIRVAIKLQSSGGRAPRYLFGFTNASLPKQKALQNVARKTPINRLELVLMRYADVDKLSKGIKIPTRNEDPWIELKAAALLLTK